MSRYEAPSKLGKLERDVRVAQGAAESNSSLLSALELQTHLEFYYYYRGRSKQYISMYSNPFSVCQTLFM